MTINVPDQSLAEGDLTGGTATWEVNLAADDITPLDANAQESAVSCPALA